MLKKIGNYYLSIAKKYGVIVPALLVVMGFLCVLSIDVYDGLKAIILDSKGTFIALAVVAGCAFIAGAIYFVLKLKTKEIAFQDLIMACFTAICIPTLIMFIFTGGLVSLPLIKWVVTLILFVVSLALTAVRAGNVD
jgi:hypothetical protein